MTGMNGKARVLVLDDEPQILASIRDLLEDDFTVLTALEAESALRLLEREDVAVIVSDQRMPGTSGHQFLSRAAEVSKATRILITAYADLNALVQAVNHGQIYAYIAKPWDPMELRVTIKRAAHHCRLVQEINLERDLLHALMDNIPDLIYFKDASARLTRINAAYARLLGVQDPDAAAGSTEADFLPAEEAARVLAEDRAVLESGEAVVDREEQRGACGARWFSTTKARIVDARRRTAALVAISRDITRRKEADEQLRRSHEELEIRVRERTAQLEQRSQEVARLNAELERRLAELSAVNRELEAFTYSASHDLRAPLRHIHAFSQLLLEEAEGELDPPSLRKLKVIQDAAERMGRMIDDLLGLSRIGLKGLSCQITGMRRMVEEILAEMQPEIEGRNIRFTVGELPFADCDPGLMRLAVSNLLANAVKFTRPRDQAVIEIGWTGEAFFVRDNGVGFNMKYADKLFGVFQRLHRKEDFVSFPQRCVTRRVGSW